MKKFFNQPEWTLIGLGVFWTTENFFASGTVSYVALLVIWLLFLQVIYKNRICGLVYGVIFSLISSYKIYMLTIGSDVASFKMLVFFSIGLIMSAGLSYKYARAKENYDESVLTVTYK